MDARRRSVSVQASCNEFADKYVEWEFALMAIDLILLRIEVYRHIIRNIGLENPSHLVVSGLAAESHLL